MGNRIRKDHNVNLLEWLGAKVEVFDLTTDLPDGTATIIEIGRHTGTALEICRHEGNTRMIDILLSTPERHIMLRVHA